MCKSQLRENPNSMSPREKKNRISIVMAPGGDDIEELTEFKRMVVTMIKQLRRQRGE